MPDLYKYQSTPIMMSVYSSNKDRRPTQLWIDWDRLLQDYSTADFYHCSRTESERR